MRFWERVSNSEVVRRDGCLEKRLESSKAALWGLGGGGGLIEGWVFVWKWGLGFDGRRGFDVRKTGMRRLEEEQSNKWERIDLGVAFPIFRAMKWE